jgi:hypothetical protein
LHSFGDDSDRVQGKRKAHDRFNGGLGSGKASTDRRDRSLAPSECTLARG